ncbi:MAG: hypothetical protein M3518_02350 [Actinomycetota bacterium]|nr:hypothetical protein [Actinomycetota bacterium]
MSDNGGGKKLSHHQDRAVAGLLSTRTIAEAAAAAGVSSRTLERWLSESHEFVAEYRAARRRVVEGAVSQLQDATTEAVDCLKRNLSCGMPSTEVRAASVILDHALKAVEVYELESRLAALEEGGEV